jgi:hypothetical protein
MAPKTLFLILNATVCWRRPTMPTSKVPIRMETWQQ